jgi:hypothetical protein
MSVLPLEQRSEGKEKVAKPALDTASVGDLLWMQPEIYE